MSVHIIMGSKSDSHVGEKVTKLLDALEIPYRLNVASAHRSPDFLKHLVEESESDVFIGIAGLAAALPGAMAAHTRKPVIGIPVSGKMNLDSLLSIVQMPPGIPVATVGLDNGQNAAMLAAEILALSDDMIDERIEEYREKKRRAIMANK